jgi:hypothetical protein
MKANLKTITLGSLSAACIAFAGAAIAPQRAAAGPLTITPLSDVALPNLTSDVQYRRAVVQPRRVVRHRRVLRAGRIVGPRRIYRRYSYYDPAPAALFGLFGAALGAAAASNYCYDYGYGYPWGDCYYGGYYPSYYGGFYPVYYGGGYYPVYRHHRRHFRHGPWHHHVAGPFRPGRHAFIGRGYARPAFTGGFGRAGFVRPAFGGGGFPRVGMGGGGFGGRGFGGISAGGGMRGGFVGGGMRGGFGRR